MADSKISALPAATVVNGVDLIPVVQSGVNKAMAASLLLIAPTSSAQGDILIRNGSGWTRLPAGTSGYVLATQGAGADPHWVAAASGSGDVVGPASATADAIALFNSTTGKLIKDSTVTLASLLSVPASSAQGDILIRNGTVWTRLAAGTAGQILATQGAGADPHWINAPSAGGDVSGPASATADAIVIFNSTTGKIIKDSSVLISSLITVPGSSAQGDILYHNGTAYTRLAAGTSGQFLQTKGSGANPIWSTPTGSGDVVGPASSVDGKIALFDSTTGKLLKQSSLGVSDLIAIPGSSTRGDVLIFNGTIWTRLAAGTAGQYLKTGGAGADPSWDSPAGAGDVVGPSSATADAIALFNSTTGKLIKDSTVTLSALMAFPASVAQGDIFYYSGTTLARLAAGTAGQFLKTGGAGANPSWDTPSGSGDVVGPSSATADAIAIFNSTTGKIIKDSTVTLASLLSVPASSAQGDILIRNGSGWTRLPAGTSGYVLATQGAGADPHWVAPATGSGDVVGPASATADAIALFNSTTGKLIKDSTVTLASLISVPGSSAQGDILYHNGTAYTRLAAGTAGQVLRTGGAGANPTWTNQASGGSSPYPASTKRLLNATYISSSLSTIYTAPTGKTVEINLLDIVTQDTEAIILSVTPSGGSAYEVFRGTVTNDSLELDADENPWIVLNEGDVLQASATSSSKAALTLYGIEQTTAVFTRLGFGYASSTGATLYTCASGKIGNVVTIGVHSTNASDSENVTVYIVPSGETLSELHRVKYISLAARDTVTFPSVNSRVMSAGDTLVVKSANNSNTIAAWVVGKES